ncbi:MAG TPA: class I SAM-dependent methyltransferase [Candidatus Didemnitutus sp.]|nr:class I SAM-dependent methyltransferase [Candidatus Didemnitutus sp.]
MDYAAQYAKFHPDDPAHRHGLRLLHHRMLGPLLPADRDAPILDVGCGRGYALEDVRALGYTSLTGVDTDAGQVAFSRSLGLVVDQPMDTVAWLRERPSSFAVILLMDVLEHIPRGRQLEFLLAVAQALRPGGRVILTVPNAASAIASFWFHNDTTHQSSFTGESLTHLLEQSRLLPINVTGIEFFLRPRFLFWCPTPRSIAWWLRCLVRLRQRCTYVAELGWARGRSVVLTPNLLATAQRPA